ncbi:imm11 family protein [Laceyella tengchongensis]
MKIWQLKSTFNGFETLGLLDFDSAFVKEKVERENIFRVYLDESLVWMVFVSDAFKKVVESNNLSGLKFIEVWDSES